MAVILDDAGICVPGHVGDLDSFSEWVDSADFPETGRLSFIDGDVHVDSSIEQPFTHGVVKLWITMSLAQIARDGNIGTIFTDRVRLRNDAGGISNEPNAMFVSVAATASGRVRLVEGTTAPYREFEGSPEMVLEVVSDSSEEKDTVLLRDAYFRAGVQEYWLVDARDVPPSLEILRHQGRGYAASRRLAGGWVRSQVFGRAFRLLREAGPDGNPQFTLESGE